MSYTAILRNTKYKLYHNEIERTITIFYKTKRDALKAQKNLRNKLFNSLTIYSFNNFVYSRNTYKSATHWSSEVHGNALLIKVVKVKKIGEN